ncbi:MAG: adenine deaminase C-terminal domain-containing protein [Anaerocolumna sp.]
MCYAMGVKMQYVDLLIKNAFVYNTFLQCFDKKDISIVGDKFFYIGEHCKRMKVDKVVDYNGKYIIPGLVDIHMHIESSMTVPGEFSKAVLPHGVTTVVADPHEIANVFGIKGIRHYLTGKTLLDIFYGIPSSVPALKESLETSGSTITEKEVSELLKEPKMLCLGEVMNFKDLTSKSDTVIRQIIKECRRVRPYMPIEGHCPKIEGYELTQFLYAGVDADHTQQTPKSIYEKITNGMFLELQKKSLTAENIEMVVKHHFYEYIALITDDVMADHLLEGHLNQNIKLAIDLGMPPEKAIYCSTYTPSRRMHLTDRGCIAPGKIADFVVLEDVKSFSIHAVYKNGKQYTEDTSEKIKFPKAFYHSIHCKKAEESDFVLRTDRAGKEVVCNVIRIEEHSTFTKIVQRKLPVEAGIILWENNPVNLALLVCFERHGKNGNISYALVEGAITKEGAIATTWSHDSHNLIVMGNKAEDMVLAQRKIVALQGGYAVYEKSNMLAAVKLEIGGIISDVKIEQLAEEIKKVRLAMKQLGYRHDNEIMSFSTLTLPVSPDVKLTDFGLLDVKKQCFIPLVQSKERIEQNEEIDY